MRQITCNYKSIKGKRDKYASLCVGAGRAGEILRKDVDVQMAYTEKECGFKYLRFHGIFHDELGVVKERDGKMIYNWMYVDQVYDALIEKGIKPFVELGFMPEALASGEQTIFWWKGNVTPPKDYDKWYDLIYKFVTHLKERYGQEEVATWYFEVWNEPNHPAFFSGTMEEYFKMYAYAAKAIKTVCKDFIVGGPATAANAWVSELIEYCHTNELPLDFASTHTYGAIGDLDEFGEEVQTLNRNKNCIINDVKSVKEQILKSAMPNLELHYTEWSSCFSPRDPVHDTYMQAPYVLHNLKNLEGSLESMSYWVFTDIFEESGIPPTPFHGGFGLINIQSINKPAYYAYKFINGLGDTELQCDDDSSWICRNQRGVQVLIWDFTLPEQDCVDQIFYRREQVPQLLNEVPVTITGLEAGDYTLTLYRIGHNHNDCYSQYIRMGAPSYLSPDEVKALRKVSDGSPELIKRVHIGEKGDFSYTLPMRENDVFFFTLEA